MEKFYKMTYNTEVNDNGGTTLEVYTTEHPEVVMQRINSNAAESSVLKIVCTLLEWTEVTEEEYDSHNVAELIGSL